MHKQNAKQSAKQNAKQNAKQLAKRSKYKGIYKYGCNYFVRVWNPETKKQIHIGGFTNIFDAIKKHNSLSKKIFGKRAVLNEIPKNGI